MKNTLRAYCTWNENLLILPENYSRSEQSLLTTMAVMVLKGVSIRKIDRITEDLCGTSFSKLAVSGVCKSVDTYVD